LLSQHAPEEGDELGAVFHDENRGGVGDCLHERPKIRRCGYLSPGLRAACFASCQRNLPLPASPSAA
jgi:hypothetical protein